MSMLVEELEQAADALDAYAATLGAASCTEGYLDMRKDATRLRQRAAWVRELGPPPWADGNPQRLYERLTGPIPAAEPCAGCLPAEGDYGDGPPPMVLGRHVEGCSGAETAPTERKP